MRYSAALQGISDQFIKKDLLLGNAKKRIEVGDIVKVGIRIQEGKKQRIQPYSGTVIALHGNGVNSTMTVRRVFQGVGIERVFLTHSPCSAFVEVVRRSRVRRAKLYYLRDRVGKSTRLKTKLV